MDQPLQLEKPAGLTSPPVPHLQLQPDMAHMSKLTFMQAASGLTHLNTPSIDFNPHR